MKQRISEFSGHDGPNSTLPLDPATTAMTSPKLAYETTPTRLPSDWNSGRDQIGMPGRLRRNPQLGYPPETALTLGRFVAGSSARAKARRLGIIEETHEAEECHTQAAALNLHRQTVHLLGRNIPVLAAAAGMLRPEDDGKPASDRTVHCYIARAFGDWLGDVRRAMEALAVSLPPEKLNRVGLRLYERLWPEVPERTQRWGAKGDLRVERIVGAAG